MIMNERKIQMLEVLSGNGAVSVGLVDLIDRDYQELEKDKYLQRYWGTGGAMCSLTDAGRTFLAEQKK